MKIQKKLPKPFVFLGVAFVLLLVQGERSLADDGMMVNDLDLTSKTVTNKSQILIGAEVTSMTISSTQIFGAGARFGFEFALSPRFSILPTLSLVVSGSGNGSLLYTGIGAEVRYSFFGSYQSIHTDVFSHGKLIASELGLPSNRLSLAAGIDQLLLNGTNQIYPASGITGGIGYSFPIFSSWFEVSAKEGFYEAQGKNVTATMVNVSVGIGG